jgi:hypothetical protein
MSGGVGLRFATGGEDSKVFEFRAAIQTLVVAGATVGVALPVGAGAHDVERWPLVASFAVEGQPDHGTLPALGFLTLRHPLVDASFALEGEFRAVDAIAVQHLVAASFDAFRDHWRMAAREVCRDGTAELTEARAIEQLSLLYEAGRDADATHPLPPPRALLGQNSENIDGATAVVRAGEGKVPLHVVLEGSSSMLRCCRTFFLATGKTADGTGSASAALVERYLSLLAALHAVVPGLTLRNFGSDLTRRAAAALGGDLRVHVDLRDALGGPVDPALWRGTALAYVRLSLHGLAGGAVCVGDTFVVGGNNALLTGGGCAPYCVAVASDEGFEGAQLRALSQAARNATMLRDDLGLGKPTETVAGDAHLLFEAAPLPWASATGQLRLFDRGFALLNTGLAPLLLPLQAMAALRVVELEGGDALLLATLHPASKPWHELSAALASILPGVDGVSHAALFLPANSRLRAAVLRALPDWRFALGRAPGLPVPPLIQRAAADLARGSAAAGARVPADLLASDARAALAGGGVYGGAEEKKDEGSKAPVAVLMGLAGSGVTDALASLESLCPDDVQLTLLFAAASNEKDVQDALERLQANAAEKGAAAAGKKARLVLGLATSMGAIQVGLAVANFPGLALGALTAVVGVSFDEAAFESPHRHLRPGLLGQWAAGWASVVLLVDAAFHALQRLVRRSNALALVARGSARLHLSGPVIAALLDPASFQSPAMVAAREAHLCPGWEDLGTLPRALLEPPAETVRVRVEGGSFCPTRFGRSMLKIFPDARLRLPATPAAEPWARPGRAPLSGVRRLWQLAQRKVAAGRAEAASLAALDGALVALPLRGVSSVAGVVCVGGVCVALEGSAGAVTAAKVASPSSSQALGPFACDLAFACPDQAQPRLEELLHLAVDAGRFASLSLCALPHMSGAEVASILDAAAATTPLPNGWLFDGTS